MARTPAFVHVDLDASWAVMRHFGVERASSHEPDVLFDAGMPALLELFSRCDVASTLFVVGEDVRVSSRAALLRQAMDAGHRLANHSLGHIEGFGRLRGERLRGEIAEADRLLRDELEAAPVGFRAPNFEMTPHALEVLLELGYWYDGSVIGSTAGPLLRAYHGLRTGSWDGVYFGSSLNLLAPRRPYFVHEQLHRPGNGEVMEVPVSTHRPSRLPVHGSYLRVYPRAIGLGMLRQTVAWYADHGVPFTLLLHLSDVAPPERENELRGEPGNQLSQAERMELYRQCLEIIAERFEITTTEAWLAQAYGFGVQG